MVDRARFRGWISSFGILGDSEIESPNIVMSFVITNGNLNDLWRFYESTLEPAIKEMEFSISAIPIEEDVSSNLS